MLRSLFHGFTGDSEAQNRPDIIEGFARALKANMSMLNDEPDQRFISEIDIEAYRRFNSRPRKRAIDIMTSLLFFRTFPPLYIRCEENASSSVKNCTRCYAKRGLEVVFPEQRCTQCNEEQAIAVAAMDDDADSTPDTEKLLFSIDLQSVDAVARPRVFEEVKNIQGLSFVDSEKFVGSLPKMLKTEITKNEVEKIVGTLKGLGGVVGVSWRPEFPKHNKHKIEQEDWTFSEFMDRLAENFESPRSTGLQICAIVTNLDRKLMSESFTFSDKLFMSLKRRHSFLYRIPYLALVHLLIFRWEGASPFIRLSLPKAEDLPTGDRPQTLHTDCGRFRPDADLHFSHSAEKSDNLPSRTTAGVSLEPRQPNYSFSWQSLCPSYDSDFQIYLWESWRRTPERETADIHIYTPPNRGSLSDKEIGSATKALIVFKSSPAMEAFRDTIRKYYWEAPTFRSGETLPHECSLSLSEDIILTLAVLSIIKVAIADTDKFVKHCFKQITNMRPVGRDDPSASKIRLLFSLEDHRSSAQIGVSDTLETLINIKKTLLSRPTFDEHPRAKEELRKTIDFLEKDLKYLLKRLRAASGKIRECQKMIKEYLALTQGHRAFILTIVAALYLPLSLVTGILGMNITLNPPEGSRGFSSFLNATTRGLQTDARNATVAILSSLNTTNVFLWDLKWFGIFAGPLVLTVPLSVAIGRLLRISAKYWVYYKIYWRWIVVAIAFLMFPTIYWVLPYYSRKYQSSQSTDGSGGFTPGYVAYVVLNVVFLGLFAGYQFCYALYKKKDQVIWFIFLLIVAACFGIDFSPLPPGRFPLDPIMALPWLYLVGLRLRTYISTLLESKKSKALRNDSVVEMGTSSNGVWELPRAASAA